MCLLYVIMKLSSPLLTACVVVTVTSLAWIAGITLALVHFLELANSTGWIIAGSLGFLTAVAVGFIQFEIRHAIVLPDHVDADGFDTLPGADRWNPPSVPSASGIPAHAFRVPGEIC